jgi:hypothetical protein
MREIYTDEQGWQEEVKKAMDAGEPFRLVTEDEEWQPNSNNPLSVSKWMWGSHLPSWVASLLTSRGVGLGAAAHNSANLDDGEKAAIAGAGGLMVFGAGAILLAFFDPEPTSKLALLVGGGLAAALGGGTIFVTILITRKDYEWEQKVNPKTGEVEWVARPKGGDDEPNAPAPA